MKLSCLVALAGVISALQIPLAFRGDGYEDTVPLDTIHYSTVDKTEWPVELEQYCNDKVIRASVTSAELDGARKVADFSVWAKNNVAKTIDIQIDDDNLKALSEYFPKFKYSVIIDDLAQSVFESYPDPEVRAMDESTVIANSEIFFQDYRPLQTINAWLDMLQQSYPGVLSVEDIGETYEKRPFRVVHFSVPTEGIDHEDKKTLVVTSSAHAREWISTTSTLYLLYRLLQEFENDPSSDVINNLNFIFIPVTNPDGYDYTWNGDRLWRKNRQNTTHDECKGIDIDHSYDYHWTKSKEWACSEDYSGEHPFEAYESRIWNDYLNATNDQHTIAGYIDLHSYSQEVLYPYAYSCNDQPRDEENLIELAYGISKTIRVHSGKYYSVLPACIDKDSDSIPDMGAGSALDYMYHNKAFWAYQIKLRDTGSHGFLLPGKYIEPVGQEVLAGIRYFVRFILSDDR